MDGDAVRGEQPAQDYELLGWANEWQGAVQPAITTVRAAARYL